MWSCCMQRSNAARIIQRLNGEEVGSLEAPSAFDSFTSAVPPTQNVVTPPLPSEQCRVPSTVQTPFSSVALNGRSDSIFSFPYTEISTASATLTAVVESGTKPSFGV